MTAEHDEQVARFYDYKTWVEVHELRCTVCRVVVDKFRVQNLSELAAVQQQVYSAWQRHITPPKEMDYQI